MDFAELGTRLDVVRGVIADRQARSGEGRPVRIVAVTKTHGPEAVRAAVAAGLPDVGENRVQEALQKQEELVGVPATWHLIGNLQRKKARQVVGRFALIHSVDRADLAVELARRVPDGARQAILVEVNCADEPQKGGVPATDLDALLDLLDGLPSLEVRGLMTMAPLTEDEGVQRRCFGKLRALRDQFARAARPLPELSMGMSGDFPAAVAEGATMLRLGTVLFGEREP
jgi:pyridoxal phosphate enzyme (YggS family)